MNTLNLPFYQFRCLSPCESDCDINLFMKSDDENPRCLKKLFSIINYMVELEYITIGVNSLQFTNSGLNYMKEHHQEFIENIHGKDIDFGIFSSLINQLKATQPKDICRKFCTANSSLGSRISSEIDYNNIRFSKKDSSLEPMD